jgi:predicted AlkP superfamily pyrophosphatase or phosphodiesterase
MVTGLLPDHSGIVANTFLDPGRPGFKFYSKDAEGMNPFWWAPHEPLWITAEKHGVRSATMFWPGSEVAHDNVRPSDWIRFDTNFGGAQRVRTIIDWMRRPAAIRPAFVTFYLDATDVVIHKVDIGSPDAIAAIRQVDTDVGALVAGLKALGQPVNLVVVSDHGMRAIEPDKTTDLNALLPASAYTLLSSGPFATIDPVPGHEAEVATALLKPLPFATCWRKQDVPPRYLYGANIRVAAIVCQAAAGGEVMAGRPINKSDHGYDPDDPLMTTLFIANGPGFRSGAHVRPRFDNVDIYPMLARLIGVAPLANDGDPATLGGIIR